MADDGALPTPHETFLAKLEALPGELWQLAVNKGYSPQAATAIQALVADGAAGVKDAANAVVAAAEPALAASEAFWPPVLLPFAPLIIPFVDSLLEKERDALEDEAAQKAAALELKVQAWGAVKAAAPATS